MPGVTLSARFRHTHAHISLLRSPRGGGRANRTTGPRAETTVRAWPEALASSRGRTAAGADQLLAAEAGRLVHRALHGNRPRLAEAARRPRAARARPPALRAAPAPRLAADRADQPRRPRDERPADPLPRRARRQGRPDLRDAQIPDTPPGRGGTARPVPRPRARRPHARRDHAARRAAAGDATGRAAAALERPPRRHEPRRPSPDTAALLRAAGERASRVLAAPRRAPRPDRLRPDAPRLRDLDGREARPRPRVDRRSLGPALPADDRRHGAPNRPAVSGDALPAELEAKQLLELSFAQLPVGRGGVLAGLLGTRCTRDHRRDGRLRREPRDRQLEQRAAVRGRELIEPLDPVESLVGQRVSPALEPGPRRRRRAAPVLAGQEAACEREVRNEAHAQLAASRQDVLLGRPLDQAVAVLQRSDRPGLDRFVELLDRGVGDPDRTHGPFG